MARCTVERLMRELGLAGARRGKRRRTTVPGRPWCHCSCLDPSRGFCVGGCVRPPERVVRRGMLQAIDSGYVQTEIQRAAFGYQRAVETKEQIVVGVNDFQAEEERQIPMLRIEPALEREQVTRLQALRVRRNAAETRAALAELERRAKTNENLLPAILAAVEKFATVGEISDTLRRVFGEYQESVVL